MAAQFDRNKPHATIYNDPEGRFFYQDNQFFTAEGKLWAAPVQEDAAPPAPAAKSKKTPASQLDAQLQEPA